jgi:hypothetical protein
MRAPWNVSWAQEISAIGIHNSQYFLGPMNSFWGSQLRGGAARALRPPPPLPPLAFSPPLFSAAPLRSPCLHSSHLLPPRLSWEARPDPDPHHAGRSRFGRGCTRRRRPRTATRLALAFSKAAEHPLKDTRSVDLPSGSPRVCVVSLCVSLSRESHSRIYYT